MKPRIQFEKTYTEVIGVKTAGFLGEATSFRARFRNHPRKPYPESIARDVIAEIEYRTQSGELLVGPIVGRWADTDQPTVKSSLESTKYQDRVDFGIEETRDLDLIIHYLGEYGYAFNRESYKHRRLANPAYQLKANVIKIRVKLNGPYIKETFSFTIVPLTTRCNEHLDSLPFSSDHLWHSKPGGGPPSGECVNCGLTPDEWIQIFEKRLAELGQVGAAIIRPVKVGDNEYQTLDVKA